MATSDARKILPSHLQPLELQHTRSIFALTAFEFTQSEVGKDIEPGTGSAFVQTKDGTVFWFCSNKCKVNRIKRGLKSRDTKWTSDYQKGGKAAR